MTILWSAIDEAVGEALAAHPDYLTPRGHEYARALIVRRVTKVLRDAASAPKTKADDEAATASSTEQPASLRMGSWSREWWCALIRRCEQGRPTDLMMRCAATGSVWAAETEPLEEAAVASMKAYPCDAQEVAAWRAWFASRRVILPNWRERVWVFLPSPEPPAAA